jgi:hypothetical protein
MRRSLNYEVVLEVDADAAPEAAEWLTVPS